MVWHHVEIARWVGVLIIDGGGNAVPSNESARSAASMASRADVHNNLWSRLRECDVHDRRTLV